MSGIGCRGSICRCQRYAPRSYSKSGLTHTVTHTRKRADKNNGEDRAYLPQYTERKASKSLKKQQAECPDTLRNQQVRCSSHPTSSNLPFRHTSELGGIPEWPKGADCKSVVSDFGGSNSPPPTKKSDILWIPDFFAPFCCICVLKNTLYLTTNCP